MLRVLWKISLALFVVAWLVFVSPFGSAWCLGLMTHNLPSIVAPLLQGQFIMMVCSLMAVPAIAVAFWGEKRTRRRLIGGLLASLVAPSVFVWRPDGWALRKQGLVQAAGRLNGLNVELATFQKQYGIYPTTVADLNVDIRTGMVCYPQVRYRRANPNSAFSGYELKVPTGYGLGFDSFFFWPSQSYPKRIYGGEVELIATPYGVWAYVHE